MASTPAGGTARSGSKLIERSTRFKIDTSIQIWPDANTTCTIHARTANLSRTGVYVWGPIDRPVGSPVRLEMKLPAPIGGAHGSVLTASGSLVRHVIVGNETVAFAIRIDRFAIARLDAAVA